jgi:anion-transporting  ArsA/GET3 family ATPase
MGTSNFMTTGIETLLGRPFVVVTGKGGVGKSAVAASLGRCLARHGRRTLVLEIDPRENVHQLLEVPPSGGEMEAVAGGLFLQNLKPEQALDELVRRQLGLGILTRQILKSETYRQLSQGAPGLRELGILDYAETLTHEAGEAGFGPFQTVILDAPATGHGVSMLAAPLLVAEVVAEGPVGRRARQLAAFVADPANAAVVVVTQPEEMPVQEALELRQMLQTRLGREPDLLVVNGLYPPVPPDLEPDRPSEVEGAAAVWRRRRKIQERELARLRAQWPGPQVELPLLALDRGPELVAALRQGLERADFEKSDPGPGGKP